MWKTLNCKTFEEYHDAYLEMDVLLLADIFEAFVNVCLANYRLDPGFYYTSPGLSWDAMLLFTKVRFEMIKNIDIYNMIEDGMRGGISTANHRYAQANNEHLSDYNKDEKLTTIQYMDFSNLYGWAMSQSLPISGFKFVTFKDLDHAIKKIKKYDENNEIGYIFDVDLEYPEELHDLHNNLPMAAENIICGDGGRKLAPNLNNKSKYVVHIRALQMYIKHGLKIIKINRAIKFT